MDSVGYYGASFFFALHCLFMMALGIGIVALFIWLYRDAKKETLRKMVWIFLLVGAIGLLLTAPFMNQSVGFGRNYAGLNGRTIQMMDGFDEDDFDGMMFGRFYGQETPTGS